MNKKINEALESYSVFLLVWSRNAKQSNWVGAEIASGLNPDDPMFENVIIFKTDKTRLPYPIAGRNYTNINTNNLELEVKEIIKTQGTFESQIILFKEQVRLDYQNYGSKGSHQPLISDFKKFDGYHLFVPQSSMIVHRGENIPESLRPVFSSEPDDMDIVLFATKQLELLKQELLKYLPKITVEEIYDWVTHNTDKLNEDSKEILEDKQNLRLIVGDYGSGKSGFTHRLMYNLCNESNGGLIPLFISLSNFKSYHNEVNSDFFGEFCEYIKKEYRFNISNLDLVKMIKEGKIVFIIDALDELTHKLDHEIAQSNLRNILHISAVVPIFLTSRYTYISNGIPQTLVSHSGMVKINDFNRNKIQHFLNLKFQGNHKKIENIKTKIYSDQILESIVKKPLFLNILCNNFPTISKLKFINEAVFFRILTSGWRSHEYEKSSHVIKNEIERTEINQRCSERLAILEYTDNKPVTINKIKWIIEDEFQHDSAVVADELDSYTKYARDSTFLTVEESDSFRFLLKPFLEFFVASRIVSDISEYHKKNNVDNIVLSLTPEIFQFIHSIIRLDWIIKPHAIKQVPLTDNDAVQNRLDWSENLYSIIDEYRNKKHINLSNIVRLLNMTHTLPSNADLSGLNLNGLSDLDLNLSKANLENTSLKNCNLMGINLPEANLKGANLTGTDLQWANLSRANLTRANLTSCKFQRSNLSGTNLMDITCQNSDFTLAHLVGSNLGGSSIFATKFEECNLVAVDFTGASISSSSFLKSNLSRAEFADINFGGGNSFVSANLRETNFVRVNQLPIGEAEIRNRGGFVFR